MKRCQWCGVFVAATTKPTAWRIRLGAKGDGLWWARREKMLCPSCRGAVTVPRPWLEPIP